jgi:hypothetical protein
MYVSISHLGNVACWEVFKIVPTSHGIWLYIVLLPSQSGHVYSWGLNVRCTHHTFLPILDLIRYLVSSIAWQDDLLFLSVSQDLGEVQMGGSWGYPNSWLVYIGKAIYKWMMTRGTPYDLGNRWKPPNKPHPADQYRGEEAEDSGCHPVRGAVVWWIAMVNGKSPMGCPWLSRLQVGYNML